MKFTPRHGEWNNHDVYTDPSGSGDETWVGEVYECNGAGVSDPFCANGDGKPCGGWHGFTRRGFRVGLDSFNTWGHATRVHAAAALLSRRWEWANGPLGGRR